MPAPNLPNAAALNFFRKLNREAKVFCHQFTVAIFTVQNKKLIQCGSGVLISIGSHNLLVTAAHTIDAHFHLGLPILVANEVKDAPLHEVRSHVLISKTDVPHHRTDDPIDICVCDLNDSVVAFLKQQKRFATLLDIDTNDSRLPNNHYMAFGFPSEFNPVDIENRRFNTNAMGFSTFQYLDELSNFHADRQIALSYFGDTTLNDEMELVTPPQPYGISGGGIWRVHDERIPWDSWSANQIKLVAIEHTLKDKKALVGTSINLAMGFIIQAFPDLQPVYELHRSGLKAARGGFLGQAKLVVE